MGTRLGLHLCQLGGVAYILYRYGTPYEIARELHFPKDLRESSIGLELLLSVKQIWNRHLLPLPAFASNGLAFGSAMLKQNI